MKIAIPLAGEKLSQHFGHCEAFAIYTVADRKVISSERVEPPTHEHGSHPAFLSASKCDVVISGGMGHHAHEMLREFGIEVYQGQTELDTDELVQAYLDGKLIAGSGSCNHHEGEHHEHKH